MATHKANLIETLKKRFNTADYDNFGPCIVIPGEQLDLDWILIFLEEGYRFEGTRLDGIPVILVQVKPILVGQQRRRL